MSSFDILKMSQLKEECKNLNLKMTGKREDLVNRIMTKKFLQNKNFFEEGTNTKYIFTSYNQKSSNRIQATIKIQSLDDGVLYKTFNSFLMENDKKHYLIWHMKKKKFVKKMSFQKKLFEFTRDDIHILKSLNLPYEIPPVLYGESLCSREPMNDDDADDDEDEIYCDFE